MVRLRHGRSMLRPGTMAASVGVPLQIDVLSTQSAGAAGVGSSPLANLPPRPKKSLADRVEDGCRCPWFRRPQVREQTRTIAIHGARLSLEGGQLLTHLSGRPPCPLWQDRPRHRPSALADRRLTVEPPSARPNPTPHPGPKLRRSRAIAPGSPRTLSTRPVSSYPSDNTRALSYTSPISPCFA